MPTSPITRCKNIGKVRSKEMPDRNYSPLRTLLNELHSREASLLEDRIRLGDGGSAIVDIRLHEIQLVIVKIQQLLLKEQGK